jgi:hypothetical protein
MSKRQRKTSVVFMPQTNDIGWVMSMLDWQNRPNQLKPLMSGRQLVRHLYRTGWIDKAVMDYVKHYRKQPRRSPATVRQRDAWDRQMVTLRKRIRVH